MNTSIYTVFTKAQSEAWAIIEKHQGFMEVTDMGYQYGIDGYLFRQFEEMGLLRRVLQGAIGYTIYMLA